MIDLLEGYKDVVARRYDEIPNIRALMDATANHETKPFMNGFGGYNQVKM